MYAKTFNQIPLRDPTAVPLLVSNETDKKQINVMKTVWPTNSEITRVADAMIVNNLAQISENRCKTALTYKTLSLLLNSNFQD